MSFVWIFILELIMLLLKPMPKAVLLINASPTGVFYISRDGCSAEDTKIRDVRLSKFKVRVANEGSGK